MGNEQERIRRIMEDMAKGRAVGDRLHYDVDKKRIMPGSPGKSSNRYINIVPSDADLYGHDNRDR